METMMVGFNSKGTNIRLPLHTVVRFHGIHIPEKTDSMAFLIGWLLAEDSVRSPPPGDGFIWCWLFCSSVFVLFIVFCFLEETWVVMRFLPCELCCLAFSWDERCSFDSYGPMAAFDPIKYQETGQVPGFDWTSPVKEVPGVHLPPLQSRRPCQVHSVEGYSIGLGVFIARAA